MTTAARLELEADISRLAGALTMQARRGPVGDVDDPTFSVAPIVGTGERLRRLRETLAEAEIVDLPGVAVIGRTLSLRDDDGLPTMYVLVPPGEGAPTDGRIAVDSPLGAAVLGRRVGDRVEVDAPAGRRSVTIEWIG
jgi:hypothetical protein